MTTVKENVKIAGLHCADCVYKIEKSMSNVPGVKTLRVNFTSGRLMVEYDPERISLETIQSHVKKLGYEFLEEDVVNKERIASLENRELLAVVAAGIAFAMGVLAEFGTSNQVIARVYHDFLLSEMFLGASMAIAGWHVAWRAIGSLLKGVFVIDSLMLIGAIGAVLIDEFAEGAAVLFLYSIAEVLEDYSVERSRKSLKDLAGLIPKTASVKRGGGYADVRIDEIRPGEVVLVKPGGRIPVDGTVVAGRSAVNQAPITGESLPSDKDVGDPVFAGTMNQGGMLEISTVKEAKDSTLARIIELVEVAEGQKAPTERFIDRFSRYYTPSVVAFAILVATIPTVVFGQPVHVWVYKSLLLLLISCPCALALSTPISIASGITSGATNGVLFKGGAYVEMLAKIDTFAFDKTGTLTEGMPVVSDVIPTGDHSEGEVLSVAASLECLAEHPLGDAIVRYADERRVARLCVEDLGSIPGKGITGEINGEKYVAGSRRLFDREALEDAEDTLGNLQEEAKTVVIVGKQDEVFGVIALSDKIRPDSAQMVRELHRMGVKRVVMVTGDNERIARNVAQKLGVDEYFAELLPEQKLEIIGRIKKGSEAVAMVGDGVNDAPALAAADLGIAMGVAGSDTAMEAADIGLMKDDISKVPYLLALGRRTMRVVKQNIVLSISVKLLFAILAFPGLVTLWMAVAIGDMGVSLAVIFNALRLSRVK